LHTKKGLIRQGWINDDMIDELYTACNAQQNENEPTFGVSKQELTDFQKKYQLAVQVVRLLFGPNYIARR